MESFRAYLKQTKIFFIACVFMAAVSTAVICLYQLPLEAAVYLAVLWLGAGAAVFLYGYACYRQKVQNLILVEKAPEINLDRLGRPPMRWSFFTGISSGNWTACGWVRRQNGSVLWKK